MQKIYLFLIATILLTSCVPHKKLVYFQGEPVDETMMQNINKTPYKLQVNDILYITIKSGNEELVKLFDPNQANASNANNVRSENLYYTGYSVDVHGNIRLPYIGDLNVLGYTEDEVRLKIKSQLKNFIATDRNTFVTVKLAGIRYTVIGDISNPGTHVINQNKINIIEAIANAGDVSETGDRTKIEVLRYEAEGLKKYSVDITQIDVFKSEVYNILPNDIIYINPIKTKSWGIGTTGMQTFTTLASVFSIIATTILLIKSF